MTHELKTAAVLLSGGLDSTAAMAVADREVDLRLAISVDYGQRHRREIDSARRRVVPHPPDCVGPPRLGTFSEGVCPYGPLGDSAR